MFTNTIKPFDLQKHCWLSPNSTFVGAEHNPASATTCNANDSAISKSLQRCAMALSGTVLNFTNT